MRRSVLAALVAAALVAPPVAGQAPEFEVASIKPHAPDDPAGGARSLPDGTVRAVNNPIIGSLGAAYPSESGEYVGLPDWVRRDRYDIIVKPPAGTTPAQRREMWRKLFADRMKLVAHDDVRDEPIFALVLARPDGKLGPNLKPRPDCIAEAQAARAGGQPPPPAPAAGSAPPAEAEIMRRGCGGLFGPGRILSGGMNIRLLAQQLKGVAGRFVEDRTGLQGFFTIDLRFAPTGARPQGAPPTAADPGDPPEIFTALQEQLGLKLEPTRKPLQVVVIDHIERPTEN